MSEEMFEQGGDRWRAGNDATSFGIDGGEEGRNGVKGDAADYEDEAVVRAVCRLSLKDSTEPVAAGVSGSVESESEEGRP